MKLIAWQLELGVMHISWRCEIDRWQYFALLQKYILEHGEPEQRSGKQEQLEAMLNRYV